MRLTTSLLIYILFLAVSFSQTNEIPNSLTLDQAVELALSRNQDIISAQKEVEKAKGTVGEARSAALPQLNFTATANHYDNYYAFLSGSGLTGEMYGLTYSFSQVISSFGRVSNALLGAKIYVQLAETKLESTRRTVTYQVTKSYNDVLLMQELVRVQQEAVDLAESHLRMAQLRYEQGVGSEFEMLRAQVRVANLQPALINAKNNLTLAKQNLNANLNIQPEQSIDINGTLNYTDYIPSSDTAWQIAQLHRPDLRILYQTKQINEVQLKYYRAGYRPNLYLVGEWDRQRANFSY